jgi:hypothetical protein
MAEIIKTNQENYVPCSISGNGEKNILTKIKNVQMTFQECANDFPGWPHML